MKRRVIQIGKSTHLISLPKKWCNEVGIKKGDEVEIEQDANKLTLTYGDQKKFESITLDATGCGEVLIKIITSIYKAGYDEIRIRFSSPDELKYIQEAIDNNCIGFEIVAQEKDHVIARKISDVLSREFDSVLRRTFAFLQMISKEAYAAAASKNKTALSSIIAMDAQLNKFTCFCRRVLNEKGIQHRRAPILYSTAHQIESIGDFYKVLCKYLLEHNVNLSNKTMALFAKTNSLLNDFCELFYNFDIKKIVSMAKLKRELEREILKTLCIIAPKEVRILSILENILVRIWGTVGDVISFRY